MANIQAGRERGGQDFSARGDPALMDMGELAARISGIGLGQINRSSAPQVIADGFSNAADLTSRWTLIVPSGAVVLDAKAFSGVQSVKFTTNAVLNAFCGISRTIPAYPGKWGLDVMFGVNGGNAATNGYTAEIVQTYGPGLGLQKISSDVLLICDPATGKFTVKIFTQSFGAVNLVTNLGLLTDPVTTYWHNVKCIIDANKGLYQTLFVDNYYWDLAGLGYDLQNFGAQTWDGQSLINIVELTTNTAAAKTMWADDFIVTRDEP